LLDDFGVRPWNLPYDLYKWCKLAQHAHACISFMSVGAVPIVHRINRWLMLGALRSAHYRSFRDAYSRDYLAQLGFDTAKDEIYPDLVFSLPADQLPDRTPRRRPVRTVGVGVMGYYGWQNSQVAGAGVYADYIAKMNQFVLWLLHEGYEVQLLAGEYPTDERPRQDVAAYVQSAAGADVQRRVHVPAISSQQDLLAAVAGTDLVIATRFHNAVAALLLSRPVISIGYSKKNDVLLQDVGLGAFCQTVEELDVERLKAQFTGLAATLGEASEQVYQRVDMYRRALDEQYARLLSGRNEPSAAVWEKA
jgi:polysaccharide pyruvyl transferase WcaK-like protein